MGSFFQAGFGKKKRLSEEDADFGFSKPHFTSRSSRAASSPNSTTSSENESLLNRGGDAVYVQSNANQKNKRRAKQPSVHVEKHLDDDNEVLVAKFDYEEFVWWSEYLTGELPALYKKVLEKLRVWKSEYDFELGGFTCFRHREDKSRRCDVKFIYLPQIWCGKYHPYASIKHKRRACMRTLKRLEYLEKKVRRLRSRFDYLIKLDLTLPKFVSLAWADKETELEIRNALKRFLELLHDEKFPNKKSQFGVVCNHHYWRTTQPLEPHRHIHLTIPNVCYNKSKNRFYRFSPYLDENVVKECWKRALTEHGLWADKKSERPDCRLRYVKFSDRSQVINRLSYCCRKPTEDLIEYLRAEDLKNFEEHKEFAEFLINYTPRVVNLGFLTNLKRFGYYSNKSTTMICPICGGEMVAMHDENGLILSLDRPPPYAVKLLRDRKGIWYVLS